MCQTVENDCQATRDVFMFIKDSIIFTHSESFFHSGTCPTLFELSIYSRFFVKCNNLLINFQCDNLELQYYDLVARCDTAN